MMFEVNKKYCVMHNILLSNDVNFVLDKQDVDPTNKTLIYAKYRMDSVCITTGIPSNIVPLNQQSAQKVLLSNNASYPCSQC
jgi:hypothetical protein